MRKLVVNLIAFLACITGLNAQKHINFIINIDDHIPAGSLLQFKLIALSNGGLERSIDADYYPGNLSMKHEDYDYLVDSNIVEVSLAFIYIERCKNSEKSYTYKIDLHKAWLKHYYYVLHIYNTDKRRYRKLFNPLEGRSYTYEYDYPGGSVKRVTKARRNFCD